jgi:hypothetical protein
LEAEESIQVRHLAAPLRAAAGAADPEMPGRGHALGCFGQAAALNLCDEPADMLDRTGMRQLGIARLAERPRRHVLAPNSRSDLVGAQLAGRAGLPIPAQAGLLHAERVDHTGNVEVGPSRCAQEDQDQQDEWKAADHAAFLAAVVRTLVMMTSR